MLAGMFEWTSKYLLPGPIDNPRLRQNKIVGTCLKKIMEKCKDIFWDTTKLIEPKICDTRIITE